ncbi:hypothetical protein MHYP_G00279240 [Metynnis hypsauchen]
MLMSLKCLKVGSPQGTSSRNLGVDQCNPSETSCEGWFWATAKQALVRFDRKKQKPVLHFLSAESLTKLDVSHQ